MNNKISLGNLGELHIIEVIETLIYEKTGKKLVKDDAFFFSLKEGLKNQDIEEFSIIFNTDMLVSTTDIPHQMNYFQMGRKAILMNMSDLIVKGVRPNGIIISLGLPNDLKLNNFKEIIQGIMDYSSMWDSDYLGGDINETKEIIINPTVFGFKTQSKIIYRNGLKVGDLLVANRKFGLTGVGFDILFNKNGNIEQYPKYKKSILSILEPYDLGKEALFLSDHDLATSSIDSSDGLTKSLRDLMESNQEKKIGFEIDFDENLIDEEAMKYSEEFKKSLDTLVFNGGEEFIHMFTLNPKNYKLAKEVVEEKGGQLFKIGKVIPENKLYYRKENKRILIKGSGYEHFK